LKKKEIRWRIGPWILKGKMVKIPLLEEVRGFSWASHDWDKAPDGVWAMVT